MVCSQHARPATVADHAEAITGWPVAARQALCRRKKLHETIDSYRTSALQSGVEYIVAADHRAGVGQRRVPAAIAASGLQYDHRFCPRRRAQCAHEASRAADAFHVNDDALGATILGKEIENVGQIQHRRAAGGDDRREPYRVGFGPVEHGRRQRPGLRDQC